jgi:hypothetical protein
VNLGSLVGYLRLDTASFETGLGRARAGLAGFAKSGAAIAATAGAGIAAALGAAVVGGMNVEQANDKLSAQLGLTEAESARIGGVAGRLYADAYGGSIEEVNTAVGAVVSSISGMRDASNADVEAMTAKALDLASAFELDVARATQVAGQMITSGIATDGAHAMDLLTASMQRVPAAVREDVLDAVDEYGPFMQSIGLQGEQAMGLLVASAEKGALGLDKTGDALKEFTIRATDMSSASKVGFDALGMSQEDMTAKLLAGGDVAAQAFNEIVGGLRGIEDPAAQSQAALALFGTPLEDLNVSEIPAFLASLQSTEVGLGDVAGAADRMGQTLNDNAATNFESFKRQAQQTFVNVVGGQVIPVVNQAAAALATGFGPAVTSAGGVITGTILPALGSFTSFLQENSTAIGVIAGVIAAVFIPHLVALGVAQVVTAAKSASAWAVTQATTIRAAAVHSAQIVRMVAGWVLLGVQSMLQAGRMAAAWLIAMGPVGWVIAAVIALVALIVANWDTVVAATKAAWSWVTSAVGAAWNWIKSAVASAAAWVMAKVTGAWQSVQAKTAAVWAAVRGAVQAAWSFIQSLVASAVARVLSTVQRVRDVVAVVRGAFDSARTAASTALSGLISLVSGVPGRIKSALGNVGSILLDAGRSIIDGLKRGIEGGIQAVKNTLSKVTGLIPDWKGPMDVDKRLLAPSGAAIMGGLERGITSQLPSLRSTLAGVTDAVAGTSVPVPAFHVGGIPDAGRAGAQAAEASPSLPRSLTLRVGEREFTAYVQEEAVSGLAYATRMHQ